MQEQNFEKQVREKMDDLSFVPSAPVWEKVKEQIKRKKEKRRYIFWLLPLMIAIGLGWWLVSENGLPQWIEPRQVAEQHQTHQHPLPNPGIETQTSENPATVHQSPSGKPQTELLTGKAIDNYAHSKISRESKIVSKQNKAIMPGSTDHSLPKENNTAGPEMNIKPATPTIPSIYILFNADSISNSKSLYEKDILIQTNEIGKQYKKRKWQFAVSAQVGISGISEGFGKIGSAEMYFDASPSMSTGGNTPLGNPQMPPPSTLKAGVAFSAGLDVKRRINRRLALVGGLHYAYYSNTIQVGSLIYRDTAINRTNASVLQTLAFYRNDAYKQDYINQYHFIQIPVSAEYKLVKSLPLFIQAGAKLEQLLSSNALFYNKYAGVYVEDKEMLAQTGVNLFTGISYTFRSQKAFSFTVGPQVQYGITNLTKNKNNNQHLYFAGISTQFFLKK